MGEQVVGVELGHLTRKGKNRITYHGPLWHVERYDNPPCFGGQYSMLLRSVNTDYLMWVKVDNDENFEVINSL